MAKQLTLKVSLPVTIFREGKTFVAYTPALDLSTSDKTYEGVRRRFDEIVQIFFEELLKKGTLGEVLSELGWQKVEKQWFPPIPIVSEVEEFSIPLKA